jgi:hypothetical protein
MAEGDHFFAAKGEPGIVVRHSRRPRNPGFPEPVRVAVGVPGMDERSWSTNAGRVRLLRTIPYGFVTG